MVEPLVIYAALTVILFIIRSFPSPTRSVIPDLKPPFSANPSHCSLSFSSSGLTTWIPQTFIVTSEHIGFYFSVFLLLHFLIVGCVRSIKLTHAFGFRAHVKIAPRIVSYRMSNCSLYIIIERERAVVSWVIESSCLSEAVCQSVTTCLCPLSPSSQSPCVRRPPYIDNSL